jgi:Fe-S oxidoreductase
MVDGIHSSAQVSDWSGMGHILFVVIHLVGLALLSYIVYRRMIPLLRGERDTRFDRPLTRLARVFQYWLAQWKHPRYPGAGLVHILIFAGFITLLIRSFALMIFGLSGNFEFPGEIGHLYDLATDWAATVVFICMIVAAVRRIFFKPARYAVPAQYGKTHSVDAVFLLGLIATLMLCDIVFAASNAAAHAQQGMAVESLAVLSFPWLLYKGIIATSLPVLLNIRTGICILHELTFYFLLCYRPFGIQFHVITSLFNVYFAKLDRGTVKPVRWGAANLDELESFGVKKFEDFTWKHMLDFYSCADCGRCSDNCPANAVGRPLSPRFISIKARDYSFQHYPVFSRSNLIASPLIGSVYSEDEVWSCTTCGVCEEECPLLIEYIDKMVDLRRGLVDDGKVPQSIQRPLKALETRGNPYGKTEKKRADWTLDKELRQSCKVKILDDKQSADTLFFVDSITSYDDRIQAIGRATARILDHIGENFGILGALERDSGHDVRRFGEEMLFVELRSHNTQAIKASGAGRIVTADPHAYNALKNDYKDVPPVEHISQVIARQLEAGKLAFNPVTNRDAVYTYHDPCYLGRHNQLYDDPRRVLDAIPGLKRVEMDKCRDRSFCCGGGGLMLFYEPKEDQRMGVKRVQMAADAGANVIVTACPFCMVNMEDAIKVAGMEDKMTAIDLAELVDAQIVRRVPSNTSEQIVIARETSNV